MTPMDHDRLLLFLRQGQGSLYRNRFLLAEHHPMLSLCSSHEADPAPSYMASKWGLMQHAVQYFSIQASLSH